MRARTAGIAVAVTLVGILLAAVSTADGVGLWQAPEWEPTPRELPQANPSDDTLEVVEEEIREDDSSDLPRWVEAIITTMLIAAAVVGSIALLVQAWEARPRLRIRRPGRSDRDVEVLPDVGEAVTEDAERQRALLLDGSPRNAIVRTWLRLEQTVVDVGFERDPSDTATEFTERVLSRYSVEPGAITALAALYREARFSSHPIDEEMRTAAIDALDGVHRSLRAKPKWSGGSEPVEGGVR
ncbi:MAG: DUF4129 domain-containing protein [Actinomycetota bacterium]